MKEMHESLQDLTKEFTLIVIAKNDIETMFQGLKQKIVKLKDVYDEFLHIHKHNEFVFGLDSFKFQSKLLDNEYEDILRLYKIICNRMYGEYYKLYKMILQYVESNIKEKKILLLTQVHQFPVYLDLEPYKEYDFKVLQSIHENIVAIMMAICELTMNEAEEIQLMRTKRDIGFNIDNFIHSFQFNVNLIIHQLQLFRDYLLFFHKTHLKHLRKIMNKLDLFSNQLNLEIRMEEKDHMDHDILEALTSLQFSSYQNNVEYEEPFGVDSDSIASSDIYTSHHDSFT